MPLGKFHQSTSAGGQINSSSKSWELSISKGNADEYRLAQIDNYSGLRRNKFPIAKDCHISMNLRASSPNSPGTWGMGLWNDPFGFSLGLGARQILPTLPNAAWFFFQSSENFLSFSDSPLPLKAQAGIFSSNTWLTKLLPLALPFTPLLLWPFTSRFLRSLLSRFVYEENHPTNHDVTHWHSYEIEINNGKAHFAIDGQKVFSSHHSIPFPLGLVIWVDNQYAAWPPSGKLQYGTLANEDFWIEIKDFELSHN